jgi:hypothetical protein
MIGLVLTLPVHTNITLFDFKNVQLNLSMNMHKCTFHAVCLFYRHCVYMLVCIKNLYISDLIPCRSIIVTTVRRGSAYSKEETVFKLTRR